MFIKTGIMRLDEALGGGIPRGYLTEIFGPTGTGKTAFSLCLVREAQQQGLNCLLANTDLDFPDSFARRIGVDTEDLDIISENVYENLTAVIDAGQYDLVVIDSLANLAIVDAPLDQDSPTPSIRDKVEGLSSAVRATNTAVLTTNQIRSPMKRRGSSVRTPGGGLIKYFFARRIQLGLGGYIHRYDDAIVGRRIFYQVLKIPGQPPFTQASIDLYYDEYQGCPTGFDADSDLIQLAIDLMVLEKVGGWIKWPALNLSLGLGVRAAISNLKKQNHWVHLVDCVHKQLQNHRNNKWST